jgi:fructose/tagatose bisphosphate aldolase
LGSLKATKKASVAMPAPNTLAISTSRAKAKMRDTSVRPLIVASDLSKFMYGTNIENAAHHTIAPMTDAPVPPPAACTDICFADCL